MHIVIETARLLLREFEPGEGELIYRLNADPEVVRYTGDPVRDIQHGEEVLREVILPQYRLYGHGRWAVHTRADGAFIGWCGLKYRIELDEVDLGYRYSQANWGKGYATEAAIATVQYGLDVLKLTRIVGRAMPENIASRVVLEKCGMQYIGDEIVDGHPARTYEVLGG